MSLVEKALTPKSVESVVVDGEALESLRSFHELCARSSLSGGPTYCTPRQMRYFTDVPDLLHILEQRLSGGKSGNRALRLFDALGAAGGENDLLDWQHVLKLLGESSSILLQGPAHAQAMAKRAKIEATHISERKRLEEIFRVRGLLKKVRNVATYFQSRMCSSAGVAKEDNGRDDLQEYRMHLAQVSPGEYSSDSLSTSAKKVSPPLPSSSSSSSSSFSSVNLPNIYATPSFVTPRAGTFAERLTPGSQHAVTGASPTASQTSAAWDSRAELAARVERIRDSFAHEVEERRVREAELAIKEARHRATQIRFEEVESVLNVALKERTVVALIAAIDVAREALDEDNEIAFDDKQQVHLNSLIAKCAEEQQVLQAEEEETYGEMDDEDDVDAIYAKLIEPLTLSQQAEAMALWDQPDSDSNVAVVLRLPAGAAGSIVEVLGKHMARMAPGKWLFDETLNCYMWLLQTRDDERVGELNEGLGDGDEPNKFSHFFNSFFFAKLLESGRPNHKSVKRFAKKITSVSGNVFKLDKIIIPVNVGHSHWCLCVAYIQQRRIQYYDSMNGAGDTYLNGLKYYLQEEAKKWVGDPSVPQHLLDFDSWTLVPSTGDTPQQNNCSDCGVFTCTFANYISQNLKLRFSQSNINHFRQRITYDLAYAVEEIEEISNR